MAFRIVALDHVQLAMPEGRELDADAFYRGVLGFEVLAKPEPLAPRGGRWYVSGEVQVHLGVESDFKPAKKAHPALVVEGFDELLARFDEHGSTWRPDEDLVGVRRVYTEDPFGNRIELIDSGS